MNLLRLGLFALLLIPIAAQAQDKVGYTSLEFILDKLPESKSIESELTSYGQVLSKEFKTQEEAAQVKLQAYLDARKAGTLTPEQDLERQNELRQLDKGLQDLKASHQQSLRQRRTELINPVSMKIQTAINDVAVENGYTVVMNQSVIMGETNLLYAAPGRDLTPLVLKKLGVDLSE